MRLRKLTKPDRRLEQRILLIADLGRRRDRILESPSSTWPRCKRWLLTMNLPDWFAPWPFCAGGWSGIEV
jgi:hypothetical protein